MSECSLLYIFCIVQVLSIDERTMSSQLCQGNNKLDIKENNEISSFGESVMALEGHCFVNPRSEDKVILYQSPKETYDGNTSQRRVLIKLLYCVNF